MKVRLSLIVAVAAVLLGSGDRTFDWKSDGQRHWLRAEVRNAANDLILVSNPIYINWQ